MLRSLGVLRLVGTLRGMLECNTDVVRDEKNRFVSNTPLLYLGYGLMATSHVIVTLNKQIVAFR
jgi:hypothetical protein